MATKRQILAVALERVRTLFDDALGDRAASEESIHQSYAGLPSQLDDARHKINELEENVHAEHRAREVLADDLATMTTRHANQAARVKELERERDHANMVADSAVEKIKELETELDALKSKLDDINDDDRGAIDAEGVEA